MPTVSLRRRPPAAGDDPAVPVPPPATTLPDTDPSASDALPIADAASTVTATWSTRVATVALMAALLLGPVGAAAGVMAWINTAPAPQPTPAPAPDLSGQRAAVSEYAQRVVVAWLTATQANPEPLRAVMGAQASTRSMQPYTVADTTTADIVRATDTLWSVTVAATVTDARERTARRFYQVPVQWWPDRLAAVTLPTPVSGRPAAEPPATAYPTIVALTSPLAVSVTDFLTAYLTGDGDLTRYLTPGVSMLALTPPAYRAVELLDLRADADLDPTATPTDAQQVKVLTAAVAETAKNQSVDMDYALTLTARDGRWEITAIDPVPALDPTPPDTP